MALARHRGHGALVILALLPPSDPTTTDSWPTASPPFDLKLDASFPFTSEQRMWPQSTWSSLFQAVDLGKPSFPSRDPLAEKTEAKATHTQRAFTFLRTCPGVPSPPSNPHHDPR